MAFIFFFNDMTHECLKHFIHFRFQRIKEMYLSLYHTGLHYEMNVCSPLLVANLKALPEAASARTSVAMPFLSNIG